MRNPIDESIRDGSLVRGIITIIVIVAIVLLYATDKNVPGELLTIAGTVIGYFFGKQDTSDTQRAIRSLSNTTNSFLIFLALLTVFWSSVIMVT